MIFLAQKENFCYIKLNLCPRDFCECYIAHAERWPIRRECPIFSALILRPFLLHSLLLFPRAIFPFQFIKPSACRISTFRLKGKLLVSCGLRPTSLRLRLQFPRSRRSSIIHFLAFSLSGDFHPICFSRFLFLCFVRLPITPTMI